MTDIVHPGSGLLFMKVGVHAKEPLESIFKRKSEEIERTGVAFWGYGGNTCHPTSMVQPFARSFQQKGEIIRLCMEEMDSKHFAEQVRADEYSVDGIKWQEVQEGINVLGSRYALVISGLRKVEFEVPLDQTRVAVGNSVGRIGSKYIQGRVDKGCLEVLGEPMRHNEDIEKKVKISLVADLVEPYAVFLRNKL